MGKAVFLQVGRGRAGGQMTNCICHSWEGVSPSPAESEPGNQPLNPFLRRFSGQCGNRHFLGLPALGGDSHQSRGHLSEGTFALGQF